ncbi:MAG: hypothetical protein LH468_06175 [Nocardioides sp.]|nr:hypothetical protein [Nocardioides sp.]
MTFGLVPAAVREAGEVWSSQIDELRGARASLDEIDPGALGGPRVSGAAAAFVQHWSGAVEAMASTAQDHAAALEQFSLQVLFVDDQAADSVAGLVAWSS